MFCACCALHKLQGLPGFCRGRMCMVGTAKCPEARCGAGTLGPLRTCRERELANIRALRFPLLLPHPRDASALLSCQAAVPGVGYARPSRNQRRLQWWHLEWHKWVLWYCCSTGGWTVHLAGRQRDVLFCFTKIKMWARAGHCDFHRLF